MLSKVTWRNLFLPLGCGLLLSWFLAGCGVRQLARGEIQPPQVKVEGVTLGMPTAAGWPIFARLRLQNPNPEALTIRGYDYILWLEDRSVAQGISQGEVVLPAGGETVTEFPILVNLPAAMSILPQALRNQQRKIPYRLSGGVRLSPVLAGLVRVPFSFQGELSPKEGREFLRPYLR